MTEYIQFHKDRRDENGQRLVVRNGHLPERELVSGVGPIPVRQPRVRHRDEGRFTSAILPKYMRRAPSIDALLPALYLKGISTGDFLEALTAILGDRASGLSASNIVSLKSGWETDYKVWSQRDLSAKRYVYWWADGVKGKFRSFLLASLQNYLSNEAERARCVKRGGKAEIPRSGEFGCRFPDVPFPILLSRRCIILRLN